MPPELKLALREVAHPDLHHKLRHIAFRPFKMIGGGRVRIEQDASHCSPTHYTESPPRVAVQPDAEVREFA